MDDTAFHHTPISDQEVARRQRRLRNKRWLAFGLLVSAVITAGALLKLLSQSPYAHMDASELPAPVLLGLFAVMVYVAVAGAGGFLWLFASFLFEDGVGPENESIRFDQLDVHQAQALSSTVLLNTSNPPMRHSAARTSRQLSRDHAGETKMQGRDRERLMALHRPRPHAGGSLRVRQVL